MASIQSAIVEHLAQAFTLFIPYALQSQMDLLPSDTRHTLLGELFRVAARAGQDERPAPSHPEPLALAFAGCDVGLELDGIHRRLTLVSLLRGRH